MSINGVSNSFGATIDGLTNFQLSDLNIDTLVVNKNTQLSGMNKINGSTTFTGNVILNANLSLNGSLTLPANSIADSALSTNIPKLDAQNIFTDSNTFNTTTTIGLHTGTPAIISLIGDLKFYGSTIYFYDSPTILNGWQLTFNDGTNSVHSQINQYTNDMRIENTAVSGIIEFTSDLGFKYNGNSQFIGDSTINGNSIINGNETIDGIVTIKNGKQIIFNDSTNTKNTQISQYNNDCYFINYASGGTTYINANVVNMTSSYTYLKGGTSVSGYNTHFPYTDGYNYITGSTILRGGALEMTDSPLIFRNGNGINFFDNATPTGQCSIFNDNGYLQIHNYAEPINTGFPTQINFAVYNLNPTVPRFHNRLTIDYTAVQVRKTLFQVYDYDENGCCELQQTTGNSTILRNKTNSGSLILQTTDSSGNAVSNITMTPTSTTISNSLVYNSNITLPSTFTTHTTGQLGYIQTGVNYGLAVNPLTVGFPYGKGQLDNLPIGVWIIEGQATFQTLGAFNYTYELCIITGTGSTITYDNWKSGYYQANATGEIFGDKVSKVVINSAITSYKMLFRIIRQSGNALFSPTVGNTFLQATRIA
jgi:hypothetical protein